MAPPQRPSALENEEGLKELYANAGPLPKRTPAEIAAMKAHIAREEAKRLANAKKPAQVPVPPEAPKKKETIEDIRKNMDFLLSDDGPISDQRFVAQHLTATGNLLQPMIPDSDPNADLIEEHKARLAVVLNTLKSRASSASYAERQGEKAPKYAVKGGVEGVQKAFEPALDAIIEAEKKAKKTDPFNSFIRGAFAGPSFNPAAAGAGRGGDGPGNQQGEPATATKFGVLTASDIASVAAKGKGKAKATAEVQKQPSKTDTTNLADEGGEAYDEAYLRNLHEMEHGPDCKCNKRNFSPEPANPTWTVTQGVKPVPKEGPADVVTGKGEKTWEAALDLYGRGNEE